MDINRKLKLIFSDKLLRTRILFVLAGFFVFRTLASVPIPGVDKDALSSFLEGNAFSGLLNIFSGGGLSSLSIVLIGVGAYITASIIMQLLTMMFPKMKEMQQEGDVGRKKISM